MYSISRTLRVFIELILCLVQFLPAVVRIPVPGWKFSNESFTDVLNFDGLIFLSKLRCHQSSNTITNVLSSFVHKNKFLIHCSSAFSPQLSFRNSHNTVVSVSHSPHHQLHLIWQSTNINDSQFQFCVSPFPLLVMFQSVCGVSASRPVFPAIKLSTAPGCTTCRSFPTAPSAALWTLPAPGTTIQGYTSLTYILAECTGLTLNTWVEELLSPTRRARL